MSLNIVRIELAIVVVLAACAQSGSTGQLWFPVAGSNHLVRKDLKLGTTTTVDPRPIAGLRGDGVRRVAYTSSSQVYIASEADGVFNLVPGEISASLQWQSGGWLTYAHPTASSYDIAMAHPPDAPRFLATSAFPCFNFDGSRIAYLRGASATQTNTGDLVVESPDGANSVVLAANITLDALGFSPRGDMVLGTASDQRLRAFPVVGGAPTELGNGEYLYSNKPAFLASGDGLHVVIADGAGLALLSLDDGSRTYLPVPVEPWIGASAAFTPDGILVYSVRISGAGNLPSNVVSIFRRGEGATIATVDGDAPCSPADFDADGNRVAVQCAGQMLLVDLNTNSLITAVPSDVVLGFTPEHSVIVELVGGEIDEVGDDWRSGIAVAAEMGSQAAYTHDQ